MSNFNIANIKKAFLNYQSFNILNIKYTKQELECINNFNIINNANYKYKGNQLKKKELRTFLKTISDNPISDINLMIDIIFKLIDKLLKGSKKDSYLIIIRSSLPNTSFDIHRWHKDGSYINSDDLQLKFVTSLIGPGTLLLNNNNATQIYDKIWNIIREESKGKDMNEAFEIQDKYRPSIHEKLKKFKYLQLNNNQGCLFEVGSDNAIIHSEPSINQKRLFISIFPFNK